MARATSSAPGADPMAVLRAATGAPRGFWQAEGRWTAWAGAVEAVEIGGGWSTGEVGGGPAARGPGAGAGRTREAGPAAGVLAAVRRAAEAVRRAGWISSGEEAGRPPRWFGGAAFEPGRGRPSDAAWAGFAGAGFVLPVLTVDGREGKEASRIGLHRRLAEGTSPARGLGLVRAELDRLLTERSGLEGRPEPAAGAGAWPAGGFRPPEVEAVRHATEPESWRRAVLRILEAIRAGRVEKAVLARAVEVVLRETADPVDILERLRARDPSAWLFLVELQPGRAFVGASPELLCSLREGEVHAMAVAGSRPRSGDPARDERLGRELLESPKDGREHDIGVREVRERLQGLGLRLRVDPAPRLLRLAGVQHLRTDLRAAARVGDRHILELVGVLHPTAAVGGRPREPALRVLREAEPAGRGWYAGPVGWFDVSGEGAFTPGLRSVLVGGRELRLTAGAGIVEGSDPDEEWEEVRIKLRTVLEAVGVDTAPAIP